MAAREIKTTIAVDGEAAFKRAINEANTSIRNMGTQLTLATAQFKKDGDAMKLVETRSKALKGEIGQQEEIVKALEKAVKDSTSAFGENSQKTEKWEAELNRAKAKLVSLQNELTLNDAGLDRNGKSFDDSSEKAADYQATLQTIGKGVTFESITSGINGITSLVESAIGKVVELGKAAVEQMREAASWADDLITRAMRNSLSVEDEQRMEYASKFADTSVDQIMTARDKLISKMVKGWKSGDLDMWAVLGIDPDTARDPMDVLFELGETLRHVKEEEALGRTELNAETLAMDVFGKSYKDLLPLFNMGADAFYQKMAEAPIVSEENVEKLGSLNDELDEMDSRLETLKNTTLAQLAPAMQNIVGSINNMLEAFGEWVESDEGKEAMAELAGAIEDLFSGLGNIEFKDAVETVKNAINGIKDALIWLKDNKDNVVTALEIIAGAFALLELGETALNIGKIVSGFQTLWSGANKKLPSIPGSGGTSATAAASGGSGGEGTNLLTTTWAKALGGGVAFLATLFKNAYTAQGNDDILDKNGNLTEDAKKSGYTVNDKGEVENDRNKPVYWEPTEEEKRSGAEMAKAAETEETRSTAADIIREIGERLSDGQRDLLEDWWDSYRENPMGDESDEKWENLQMSFRQNSEMLDRLDEALDNWLTDPENEDNHYLQYEDLLEDAVGQMRINTESGKAMAEKYSSMDMRRFNLLPEEMLTATQRGAAAGISGVVVQIDGQYAGRILAPYMNAYLGSMT